MEAQVQGWECVQRDGEAMRRELWRKSGERCGVAHRWGPGGGEPGRPGRELALQVELCADHGWVFGAPGPTGSQHCHLPPANALFSCSHSDRSRS